MYIHFTGQLRALTVGKCPSATGTPTSASPPSSPSSKKCATKEPVGDPSTPQSKASTNISRSPELTSTHNSGVQGAKPLAGARGVLAFSFPSKRAAGPPEEL